MVRYFVIWLNSLLYFCSACTAPSENGSLLVRAPNPGFYEIYRIASEEPLQFISEQVGKFNEGLSLQPGNYLILGDCSFETIVVRPKETKTLIAHQVIFNPPVQPSDRDNFSIQCNRFAKTKSRQHLQNRYSLNILHGSRDLLVGMVPLRIEFPQFDDQESPRVLSYNLSGIQVRAYPNMKPKTSFFVSPLDGLLSITENQEFGHWQFLMAGRYKVEVNGTKMEAHLAEGQQLSIEPGFLKVSVSDSVNLQASSSILGTPLYVELNQGHWLDLNEQYAVLPGDASLRLNGSLSTQNVHFEEGLLLEKKARSVTIELDCSPWDWACLGSREIYLYEQDKPYPFAEGISDVPLLFFEEDAWVSIQGSRDIRYKVPNLTQDTNLKVGFVKLVPKQQHRPGQLTDLSRVEALGFPFTGHSMDLTVESDTIMPLIVGRYSLTQFHAYATAEWERRANRLTFNVLPQETIEIPYSVFVSDKKLKQIHEVQNQQLAAEQKNKLKLKQWRFRPLLSVKAE